MRLFDYLSSGNAYKVRLLLTQLGIPFERIEVDILKGESRTPASRKRRSRNTANRCRPNRMLSGCCSAWHRLS